MGYWLWTGGLFASGVAAMAFLLEAGIGYWIVRSSVHRQEGFCVIGGIGLGVVVLVVID